MQTIKLSYLNFKCALDLLKQESNIVDEKSPPLSPDIPKASIILSSTNL